jgi:hypothetical protein
MMMTNDTNAGMGLFFNVQLCIITATWLDFLYSPTAVKLSCLKKMSFYCALRDS